MAYEESVLIRKVSLSGMRLGWGMPGQRDQHGLEQEFGWLNASGSWFREPKCANSFLLKDRFY